MKNLLTLLLLLFVSLPVAAQQYVVNDTNGKVMLVKEGKRTLIKPQQILKLTDRLAIAQNASVEMLDIKRKLRVRLVTPGTGTIATLIESTPKSVTELSDKYLSYLVKKMLKAPSKPNPAGTETTTGYRDNPIYEDSDKERDSLRVLTDSICKAAQ